MERVEIGVVSRPHGVRGELRVHLYHADSTALDVVRVVTVGGRSHVLARARRVKGAALLLLEGVDTRDQALALCGASVEVLREELELEEDELLLEDLVGCSLQLEDGTPWGVVVAIMAGVQDLLVVHEGEIERYLPVVDAFLVDIDLDGQKIVVAPPEELPEWPVAS